MNPVKGVATAMKDGELKWPELSIACILCNGMTNNKCLVCNDLRRIPAPTLDAIFDIWLKDNFTPTMLLSKDGNTIAFIESSRAHDIDQDVIWEDSILKAACARLLQEEYYKA